MHRRLMITALACWPAASLPRGEEQTLPAYRIPAARLHEALSARFPVRAGLAGLVELQVSAPALHLVPARNRLGVGLVAELGGRQLRQKQAGEVDLVFALRYEPADQTVRAHDLEIVGVRAPGLPPETLENLQRLLPAMTREAVGEVVLHRFTARELALADTMGFEPKQITVVEDGLVISFGPKTRP
jgi:hypothetical protein